MPVSIERRVRAFEQSVTFEEFLARTQNFTAEYRANYANTALDGRDLAVLRGIDEPIDVLAIVKDWCPDVVANLPILARVAADTGKIRLHVLILAEDTRDVADAYPYEGRSHIPTYVFSDRNGTEVGVIVERTAPIRSRVDAFLESFLAAHPAVDRATFPTSLTEELKAVLLESALQLRRGLRELERSSFVDAVAAFAGAETSDPVVTSPAR